MEYLKNCSIKISGHRFNYSSALQQCQRKPKPPFQRERKVKKNNIYVHAYTMRKSWSGRQYLNRPHHDSYRYHQKE